MDCHRRLPFSDARVVLAEDQFLLREGLTRLLEAAEIEVSRTVSNGDDIDAAVAESAPDLALLDIRLPPTNTDEGLQAALRLRRTRPGFPVLLLSQHVEQLYAHELLKDGKGAVGYLLKDRVFDDAQFVGSIRSVAAGGTVLDPEVIERLLNRGRTTSRLTRLTPREREVLSLMAQGKSNSRIATDLVVTDKAVAKHINGILAKLDLPPADDAHRRVLAVLTYLNG